MRNSKFSSISVVLFVASFTVFAQGFDEITRPARPSIEVLKDIPESTVSKEATNLESTSGVTLINHGRQWGCNSGMWTLDNHALSLGAVAMPFKAWGSDVSSVRLYHIEKSTPGSYNKGDGGQVRYEIWTDNGSGQPGSKIGQSDNIIGGTSSTQWPNGKSQALARYPGAKWEDHGESSSTALNHFRLIDMNTPIPLTVGGHYWLVVQPTNSDPVNHFVSINGYRSIEAPFADDPNYTHPEKWILQKTGSTWTTRTGETSIYEIHSSDGFVFGRPWHGEPSQSSSANPIWSDKRLYGIGRSGWKVRQKFIAEETMQLWGVHLNAGRITGSGVVTVKLQDSSGATMEQANFPAFPMSSDTTGLSANDDHRLEFRMRAAELVGRPSVSKGSTYYLELSSTSEHLIGSCRDGSQGYFTGGNEWYNGHPNGNMQVNNGGSNWTNAYNNTGDNDDTDIDMFWTQWSPGN